MLALFSSFRGFLRPYRWRLRLALCALAASVVADLAQPWPLKLIVDSVLGHHPLPAAAPGWLRHGSADTRVGTLCGALLAIALIGGLLTYLGTYWSQSIGQRVTFDIREAVHDHMHRLSLAYHHTQHPGDLANRLTSDVERIQDVVISVVVNMATSVLTLVGMVGLMFYISWHFALLALATAPLLFATVYSYTRRIKWSSRDARKQEGRVAAMVQESLSGIQLVQAYTREDFELERFRREASGSLEAGIRATMLQSRFSPLVDVLTAFATVIVLWVGAHEVLSGQLTIGLMLVFISYLNGAYRPMRQLSKMSYIISRGTAAADRLNEVMSTAPSLPVASSPHRPEKVRGAVTFDHVSFKYPLGGDAALRDVSFTVLPGQKLALVGPTGAGKTTIASLIPRFYDVASGAVRVDDVDVRKWDPDALRGQISLVLQDTWMFQDTVMENIRYGRPSASDADVLLAAAQANVDEFAARLPDGYETLVGPRGATLSGGQRQRIAIARALLRSAQILILDEPTSGLDPRSEQLVLDALRRLMAERTTIVISHGAAPVLDADEILVIESGRISERGTPAELQADGERYRHLQGMELEAT
jgi:subfamily B ATP-binding cassette protein MsbA